jgi:hypothetical protein
MMNWKLETVYVGGILHKRYGLIKNRRSLGRWSKPRNGAENGSRQCGRGKCAGSTAWPPRWPVYDGGGWPKEWRGFTQHAMQLLDQCRGHPSYKACAGMTQRSFNKMATVFRRTDDRLFVQTGLGQRGLGFGWRIGPKSDEGIARYYEIMPVSAGIVYLSCDPETLKRRNVARGKDRSHMIDPITRPCEIAADVLSSRGVPFLGIDTTQPIEESRAQLRDFVAACGEFADADAA